jgi:hypothetical protein
VLGESRYHRNFNNNPPFFKPGDRIDARTIAHRTLPCRHQSVVGSSVMSPNPIEWERIASSGAHSRSDHVEDNALKPSSRFLICAAMTAMSWTATFGSAHAAGPYDGSWWVTITTLHGTCSSGGMFRLQIQNGGVSGGGGGFSVGGRVARNGATQVSVRSGAQHASGSGRLSGSSGSGTWSGVGSEGTCSGSWSASRG